MDPCRGVRIKKIIKDIISEIKKIIRISKEFQFHYRIKSYVPIKTPKKINNKSKGNKGKDNKGKGNKGKGNKGKGNKGKNVNIFDLE